MEKGILGDVLFQWAEKDSKRRQLEQNIGVVKAEPDRYKTSANHYAKVYIHQSIFIIH